MALVAIDCASAGWKVPVVACCPDRYDGVEGIQCIGSDTVPSGTRALRARGSRRVSFGIAPPGRDSLRMPPHRQREAGNEGARGPSSGLLRPAALRWPRSRRRRRARIAGLFFSDLSPVSFWCGPRLLLGGAAEISDHINRGTKRVGKEIVRSPPGRVPTSPGTSRSCAMPFSRASSSRPPWRICGRSS